MKKILFLSLFFIATLGLVYSAGLTVNTPAGGVTWEKGTTHNITWTPTGACTGTNVKINIFKNSVDPANFVEQLTSTADGTESWAIGSGYTSGTYIVRVKYGNNSCFGDSGSFTITDRPSTGAGSIIVASPEPDANLCIGKSYNITWTSSGSVSSDIKINIFRNSVDPSNFVEQLTSTNDGTEQWTIGSGYTAGNYIIRIKTGDNSVHGDSSVFKLILCITFDRPLVAHVFKPHSIKVVEPNGGRDLALNGLIRILWAPKNLTNKVKILLMKNGSVFGTIAYNLAPGRISYDWQVGKTILKTALPDSGFKIKVEEQGINVSDQSDRSFSIVPEKNVDLSAYISGHHSQDYGRKVKLTIKVRVNNIGREVLRNVPVKVTVKNSGASSDISSQTKTIPEVTYRGHSFEYSLDFIFRLHGGSRHADRRLLDRVATVVVDSDDLFRDRRRLNNTSTYRFSF